MDLGENVLGEDTQETLGRGHRRDGKPWVENTMGRGHLGKKTILWDDTLKKEDHGEWIPSGVDALREDTLGDDKLGGDNLTRGHSGGGHHGGMTLWGEDTLGRGHSGGRHPGERTLWGTPWAENTVGGRHPRVRTPKRKPAWGEDILGRRHPGKMTARAVHVHALPILTENRGTQLEKWKKERSIHCFTSDRRFCSRLLRGRAFGCICGLVCGGSCRRLY